MMRIASALGDLRPPGPTSEQPVGRRNAPPLRVALLVSHLVVLFLTAAHAFAHEVRPAYWELKETAPGAFETLWKQPVFADQEPGIARRLPVDPVLPATCTSTTEMPQRTPGAVVQLGRAVCRNGLDGQQLGISGLETTLMDVLVRVELQGGTVISRLLTPSSPSFTVGMQTAVALPVYLKLGVEHLLFGFDHLLFVLGLFLLSKRGAEVVKLVTAFTVAHSLTLAGTALGWITVPQRPIEALIALSILFVAVEALQRPDQRSFLARNSWTVAFGFGLLHGFGFAGALAQIGLPENSRLTALFLFNVGVEIGQLIVVAALLVVASVANGIAKRGRESSIGSLGSQPQSPLVRSFSGATPATTAVLATVMGIVSAYWFVERVWALL